MALADRMQKDARVQFIVAMGLIALTAAAIAVAYYVLGIDR